jgi:hypothetical protein
LTAKVGDVEGRLLRYDKEGGRDRLVEDVPFRIQNQLIPSPGYRWLKFDEVIPSCKVSFPSLGKEGMKSRRSQIPFGIKTIWLTEETVPSKDDLLLYQSRRIEFALDKRFRQEVLDDDRLDLKEVSHFEGVGRSIALEDPVTEGRGLQGPIHRCLRESGGAEGLREAVSFPR